MAITRRLCLAPVTGYMFGKGVYFADVGSFNFDFLITWLNLALRL